MWLWCKGNSSESCSFMHSQSPLPPTISTSAMFLFFLTNNYIKSFGNKTSNLFRSILPHPLRKKCSTSNKTLKTKLFPTSSFRLSTSKLRITSIIDFQLPTSVPAVLEWKWFEKTESRIFRAAIPIANDSNRANFCSQAGLKSQASLLNRSYGFFIRRFESWKI